MGEHNKGLPKTRQRLFEITISLVVASTLLAGVARGQATDNNYTSRLSIKGDVGYINDFNQFNSSHVGYGVSLGLTHRSGFGLSADYLGFSNNWVGPSLNNSGDYNFNAIYNIVTLTPNYRLSLDEEGSWGLRIGVGFGAGISNVDWTKKLQNSSESRVSGGALYEWRGNHLGCDWFTDSNGVGAGQIYYSPFLGAWYRITIRERQIGTGCVEGGFRNGVERGFTDAEIAQMMGTGEAIYITGERAAGPAAVSLSRGRNAPVAYYNPNPAPAGSPSATNNAAPPSDANVVNDVDLSGSVKNDAIFILAPQLAIEYDDGFFHADINSRYIYAIKDNKYFGSEGTVLSTKGSQNSNIYQTKTGFLALFIGAGVGLNF